MIAASCPEPVEASLIRIRWLPFRGRKRTPDPSGLRWVADTYAGQPGIRSVRLIIVYMGYAQHPGADHGPNGTRNRWSFHFTTYPESVYFTSSQAAAMPGSHPCQTWQSTIALERFPRAKYGITLGHVGWDQTDNLRCVVGSAQKPDLNLWK